MAVPFLLLYGGFTDPDTEVDWQARIDFDGDGSFEAGEDVTDDLKFIRLQAGRSGANDAIAVGSCTLLLENPDGDYSPFNTSGPWYGQLRAGVEARVRATFGGNDLRTFRGYLNSLTETFTPDGVPAVEMTFLDGLEWLRRRRVHHAAVEGETADQVTERLLDEAGWPAGRRALAAGEAVLPYWWANGVDTAFDELQRIWASELGGYAWQNKDGDIASASRDTRATAEVYWVIEDAVSVDLEVREDDLIGRVVHTRPSFIEQASILVYALDTPGRRIDPTGVLSDQIDPAVDPVPPQNIITVELEDGVVPITTGTFNIDASWFPDGSGFDLSPFVEVAPILAGSRVEYRFALHRPTQEAYLQTFEHTADVVARSNETGAIAVGDEGEPELSEDFAWNDDADDLLAYAHYRLAVLSEQHPRPTIEMLSHTVGEKASVLGIDVGSRLRLNLTAGLFPVRLTGDFFVESYSIDVPVESDGDIACSVQVWNEQQGNGGPGFTIAADAGNEGSAIVTDGATTGDRIWW